MTDDIGEWLTGVFKSKDDFLCEVVCIGLWKIWQARNELVHNHKEVKPHLIAQDIWYACSEVSGQRKKGTMQMGDSQQMSFCSSHWTVQSDAGCFADGTVSLGCIIKDPCGMVNVATCKSFPSVTDILSAELQGILWALQLAKDFKLTNVVFQSDAMVLVDCINGQDYLAALDPLICDCKTLLCSFNSATIMYVNRSLNTDAHQMVRIGKIAGSRTWSGLIPCMEDVVSPLAVSAVC
ncbi:uncharacterized protein LOC131595014 [Vicia villosa]|uniref:uncharacterized protein LOC131595014 n=1 Tax=Vicia villosa TaxID=3911 RepID=UPI00273A8766|nr:uncharacterized protein LOC131595014 [Vicia villosa]